MIVFDRPLPDKVTTETYIHVSLIVKIISITLASSLILFSLPATDKTQYFLHLTFNSTQQLINCISSDLQKLLKYFNGTAIAAFFKISFAPSATLFPNNLALYLKDLKLSLFSVLLCKSTASS